MTCTKLKAYRRYMRTKEPLNNYFDFFAEHRGYPRWREQNYSRSYYFSNTKSHSSLISLSYRRYKLKLLHYAFLQFVFANILLDGVMGRKILVFLLALFGMICWGLAPIFAKLGLSGVNPLAGLVLRTYISAAILTGWVLCNGTLTHVKAIPPQSWLLIGIEGILATLIGDLAYYAALKYGEVSFVTLVMSCSPLVSITTAVLFLGEQLTLTRLIGAFLIVGGIGLIMK